MDLGWAMRAVFAAGVDATDPWSVLCVDELAAPPPPDEWVTVEVRASALNHHDLWSLRGVGLRAEQCPMVLGCDAAGVDPAGNEVIVHAVIGDPTGGDETLDPARSLLSEKYPGTLADYVSVPRRNLIDKPSRLSFLEAACLPTAWLTAYRALVTRGRLPREGTVLIQGAGGGVSTAALVLAQALGARTYVTSRNISKRGRAGELGAHTYEPGARLPERVDVVIESVGAATLEHSIKCAKPGGRVVVVGATSGYAPPVDLRRVFFSQLEIVGSTMGTRDELVELIQLCDKADLRPVIEAVYPFSQARAALAHLDSGEVFGKIALDHML